MRFPEVQELLLRPSAVFASITLYYHSNTQSQANMDNSMEFYITVTHKCVYNCNTHSDTYTVHLLCICLCVCVCIYLFIYLFSHLADAFIQSDLQMRTL